MPARFVNKLISRLNMLTREAIRDGVIRQLLCEETTDQPILSEAEVAASLDHILAKAPPEQIGDVWVFGYGSLIWNPAFFFAEQQQALLYGYHRQFCLQTTIGRGSLECPGLVLALKSGGSCRGMGFRILAAQMEEELSIIWKREMIFGSYCPRWVCIRLCDKIVPALTFVSNPAHPNYAPGLSDQEISVIIARAQGHLGLCRDYLNNTVRHLTSLGIEDRRLKRIAALVNVRG